MGCLGGLRAITEEELEKLRALPRADRLPDYLDCVMVQEDSTIWTRPGTPSTGR